MVICFYLAFHLVQGDRGYMKLRQLEKYSMTLAADVDAVRTEREMLEMRVKKLRPQSVDQDLLEERALFLFGADGANTIQIKNEALSRRDS